MTEQTTQVVEAAPLGRPKKADLKKHTKGLRPGKRPGPLSGEAAILNWYKARMLTSPKSRKVLETILDAALDDDHKNQAVAWKIVTERLLPVSMFDQGIAKGTTRIAITINTVGGEVKVNEPAVEAEFEDISDEK